MKLEKTEYLIERIEHQLAKLKQETLETDEQDQDRRFITYICQTIIEATSEIEFDY